MFKMIWNRVCYTRIYTLDVYYLYAYRKSLLWGAGVIREGWEGCLVQNGSKGGRLIEGRRLFEGGDT